MRKVFIILVLAVSTLLAWSPLARSFCFVEAGNHYGVPPLILWAIGQEESNFQPTAIRYNQNRTIDVGAMQINSSWESRLGVTWRYQFDPCTNVRTAAWILRQCYQEFGANWAAVGCYHSHTPALRDAYAARIAARLQSLAESDREQ